MSIFVAGTDTEVGKTVVSAILMARYGTLADLGYWKPVATGSETDRDTTTVARLAASFGSIHEESYLFEPPLSPHLAARLAGHAIDPAKILGHFSALKRDHPDRHFVVEGVGGVLVPLTDDGYLMVELTQRLRLPTVLVARSTLGTINHTLLSLEALRSRNIHVAGVIINGPRNPENRRAIADMGQTPILGEVDVLSTLTPESVSAAARDMDRQSVLTTHLSQSDHGT